MKKANLDTAAGIAIFIVTCALYLLSHVQQIADSKYSMLVSDSLLRHGSFALDSYRIPTLAAPASGAIYQSNVYQLEYADRHLYYYFPPGSSVLAVPFVALMSAFGISPADADGTYNMHHDTLIQLRLAALLMAGLASVIFFTSRLLLSRGWSACIALGSALGTPMWSTASRGLWSDTWGIFLIGCVVFLLLAQEVGTQGCRPMLLASLLAWSYFARPTNCLPLLAVTGYLFLRDRSLFFAYAGTGTAWLTGFVAWSFYHYHQALPSYYLASRLTFGAFGMALAANLFSPSRGLFVFVPILVFVGYLLIRYAGKVPARKPAALALSVIVAHIIVVSGFPHWWAGHSYGPRFTTGLIPWFALLSILAVKARLTQAEPAESTERAEPAASPPSLLRGRAEWAIGGALLLCSIAIHANGGVNPRAYSWNVRPVNVDQKPERVWDWTDPQFLTR